MPVQPPNVIETERLKLRPFRHEDWSAVHSYAIDPEISQFQEWGPNSPRDTRKFVESCMKAFNDPHSSSYFFSIALPDTDQHIGGCVLTISPLAADEASVGYTIARPYWNQGFATEAASALLSYAFVDLGLQSITANCDSANTTSWRVMEKLGMRLINTERNARFFKGRWRDWSQYAITESEWRSRSGG